MKINDEGSSNAAYWYERAMKAEARLAEAEALLRELREDTCIVTPYDLQPDTEMTSRIDAFLTPPPAPGSTAAGS